jgi:hypothetical protein
MATTLPWPPRVPGPLRQVGTAGCKKNTTPGPGSSPQAAGQDRPSSHDKYQLSVSPLAGAQPQLEAGTGLDDAVAEPQLILPANYVAGLGFSDNNQAIGQDAKIGITDATGAMHPITARITGIQQSALLGGGGAFINKSLSTALADAQGTGAPAAHRGSPHDHSP